MSSLMGVIDLSDYNTTIILTAPPNKEIEVLFKITLLVGE